MNQPISFGAVCRIATIALMLPILYEVAAQACLGTASFSQEEIMDNREVQTAAYSLFEASHFGFINKETAMWVTFKDGRFGFVMWPFSGAINETIWHGPLPECTVANIHTHPNGRSEEPAFMDHELANGNQYHEFRFPVYVLHRRGIWKAVPGNSRAITIRKAGWVNEFAPHMAKVRTK